MLEDYLRRPRPLCADPGPGGAYLRLSLPGRPVRLFAESLDEDVSVALRRLIATNVGLPPAKPRARIPAAQIASKAVPRVEILSKPALPPAAEVQTANRARSAPAWCPACGAWTEFACFGERWLCSVCEGSNRAGGRQAQVLRYEAFSRPASGGFWEQYGLLIMWAAIAAAVLFGKPGLAVVIGSAVGGYLYGSKGALLGGAIAGLPGLLRKLPANPKGALLKAQAMPVSEGFVLWVPVKP